MTARSWTALILLAGVFALHGVQCAVGTGTHSGHGAGSVASAAPVIHHDSGAADGGAVGVADTLQGHPAAVTVAAGAADAGHGGTPRDAAGQLLTVCLAVLAAGLAVLLAVLTPRPARLARRILGAARVRAAAGIAPLRPPDLSALCLLRI